MTTMKITEDHTSHPLYPVLMAAIEQCMRGKGERHGGARTPFLEQPMFHYIKLHGRGFATGQAAKKLEEAASTRAGYAFEQEVLGAIVYAASAILAERMKDEAEKAQAIDQPQPRFKIPNYKPETTPGHFLGAISGASLHEQKRRSIDDAKPVDWDNIGFNRG